MARAVGLALLGALVAEAAAAAGGHGVTPPAARGIDATSLVQVEPVRKADAESQQFPPQAANHPPNAYPQVPNYPPSAQPAAMPSAPMGALQPQSLSRSRTESGLEHDMEVVRKADAEAKQGLAKAEERELKNGASEEQMTMDRLRTGKYTGSGYRALVEKRRGRKHRERRAA
mmetsp:Transcript_119263/g.338147  ORF Transcript_119263/g.338147 Transcript_119263/m.338147 type:complete len:173 (-) Transcript_119263:135-653(-)